MHERLAPLGRFAIVVTARRNRQASGVDEVSP
jgi:hypothetical protein